VISVQPVVSGNKSFFGSHCMVTVIELFAATLFTGIYRSWSTKTQKFKWLR